MKISTKLRIGTITIAFSIVVFSIVIFFLLSTQQRLFEKVQIIEEITESSFQLALLRSEYIAHPGDRPKIQWINMYEVQSSLLKKAEPFFTTPEESHLFDEMRRSLEENKVLFGALIDNIERHAESLIIEQINIQMIQQAQLRVADALQLASFAREKMEDIGRKSLFVVILLGSIISFLSIGFFILGNDITSSLLALSEGTRNISRGDLSHRLDLRSHDEIGELALLFNDMSIKLKEARGNLEQKVRERTMKLAESESRLALAMDSALMGAWDLDLVHDTAVCSLRHQQIFGYESLQGSWGFTKFVEHVIPEDRAHVRQCFENAMRTGRQEVQCRILRKDGAIRWIDAQGHVQYDGGKKPIRMLGIIVDCTEKKNALDEVVQSREQLRQTNVFLNAIIENIPNMIFLKDAKDLRFVLFNRAGEQLLGYDRKDLLGKNDYDFFPREQADAFTEKDHKVLEKKEPVDIPCEPIQTRLQGQRFLHTKKITIRDAQGNSQFLLGISSDITDRKKQEEELRKYRLAVDESTDGFIITDHQTRILYVNSAWTRLTGYSLADVLGKKANILKTEKTDTAIFRLLHRCIEEGLPFHSDEFVNRRKNGEQYNAELTMYPLYDDAEDGAVPQKRKTIFFVGIHSDITKRKNVERAKSEFISLASHQLRTPLTEIRWALSSLKKKKLPRAQMTMIEGAHRASGHMAETIKAMLTISHIETGELNPEPQEIVLKPLIKAVAGLYETLRAKKKIVLSIDCPVKVTIHTDEQLLKEILSNLLTNAYRYTPDGGSVHLFVKQNKNSVSIAVEDTGYGIPQHDQARISEKFFRGSNVVDKDEEGNGIGLYMVYSLVKLLGAKITFVSKETVGTTFTLTFPRSV